MGCRIDPTAGVSKAMVYAILSMAQPPPQEDMSFILYSYVAIVIFWIFVYIN